MSEPRFLEVTNDVCLIEIKPNVFLERCETPRTERPCVQGLITLPPAWANDREEVRAHARAFFESMLDMWLGPRPKGAG